MPRKPEKIKHINEKRVVSIVVPILILNIYVIKVYLNDWKANRDNSNYRMSKFELFTGINPLPIKIGQNDNESRYGDDGNEHH